MGLVATLVAFVVMIGSAPSALAAEPPPTPITPTFTHIPVPCTGGTCDPPECTADFGPIGCAAPFSIAFDRGGNAWWTEDRDLNTIGRRDAKTHAIQLFPLPIDGDIGDIILGPDGNMWVTDQGEYYQPQPFHSHIVRILTHAPYTITEFATPTAESRPTAITVGPDRNLYFTELFSQPNFPVPPRGGHANGRHSPVGSGAQITASIKEFPLLTPSAGPSQITTGADGNMWFSETAAGKIGRITPDGDISEFSPPSGRPAAIAAGPDGTIWFTDLGANNSIGRIFTRDPHTVSLFPVPGNPPLGSITTGPDGNMWFADFGGAVGRVLVKSPNTVTLYPDSLPGATPAAISCGSDGNVWTAEQEATHTLGLVHLTGNPFTAAVYSARCRIDNLLGSFGIAPPPLGSPSRQRAGDLNE